jgi:queuosine precursor transporter
MTEPTGLPLPPHGKQYRYLDFVMVGFVTVLLCSNLIGPAKLCELKLPFTLPVIGGSILFGAGNIFFPIGYIFGDILTEVYGYARARKVIWAGFGAMLFATIMTLVVIHLPMSKSEKWNETYQPAIEIVFGGTWRIALASLLAYWVGDFANSYVLAKMKLITKGRFLWTRTIGSTIVGQGLDSLIFYPLAFYGVWTDHKLAAAVLFNWAFKVGVEIIFTPLTYLIVGALKRTEHEDYYDVDTNFTPFSIEDK